MEIIKTPFENWSIEKTCSCQTKVRISMFDVEYCIAKEYHTLEEIGYYQNIFAYQYQCPICHSLVRINKEELTEAVAVFALKRHNEKRKALEIK